MAQVLDRDRDRERGCLKPRLPACLRLPSFCLPTQCKNRRIQGMPLSSAPCLTPQQCPVPSSPTTSQVVPLSQACLMQCSSSPMWGGEKKLSLQKPFSSRCGSAVSLSCKAV